MTNVKDARSDPNEPTVVVSFRAPQSLVTKLDEFARHDQRTRANFLVRILGQAVTLDPAIEVVEQILPSLVEEDRKNQDSIQAEYLRGAMAGARSVISAFFGNRAMRWVNQRVRARTKLPIPHTIPLQDDGNRYGFDSEADF